MKENWRTIVSVLVAAALFVFLGPGAFGLPHLGLTGAQLGAAVGAASGAFNAAINGGNLGDVLRGALIGGIQGGITGGLLGGMEPSQFGLTWETVQHVVGHGVVGGAANEAMGGKFQDGFVSSAVSAFAGDMGWNEGGTVFSRTVKAGIIGGTASALGGGKFANGAWTASFQHLLNRELHSLAKSYDPSNDKEWLKQIESANTYITKELSQHEKLFSLSIFMDLDPRLTMSIIVNETRGWGEFKSGGLGTEYFVSTWKSLCKTGRFGNCSIGPAQLGAHARSQTGTKHLDALTFDGAARGAMTFLSMIRKDLITSGVALPDNAQIASRYNAALKGHNAGTITKYGLQVEYIIKNQLYAKDNKYFEK